MRTHAASDNDRLTRYNTHNRLRARGGISVTYLEEIPAFPPESARLLESRYGIATAEAFYEHALREPKGLRTALGLKKKADLEKLVKLVEDHLPTSFVRAARAPLVRHARGALEPGDPPHDR
jgi:hypothetical protein